jgi:predicted dehydrogenase
MREPETVSAAGPLRVGVVGVGVMGSNHARVVSELPGVKLVGVADPDRKRCDQVARTLGCASFADADALMRQGVDAVTIAAPTHLHRDIAIDCAARGIHILVEKPIASTVEESRAVVAAARRAGVTLMVGHVERFNPAVQSIKRAIKDQDILSIAITRVGPFPPRRPRARSPSARISRCCSSAPHPVCWRTSTPIG